MKELFPDKKPGDILYADDFNAIQKHCRTFARFSAGSFTNLFTSSLINISGIPPWGQIPVWITDLQAADGDTDDSGLYKVSPMVYLHDIADWVSLDTDFIMDERALGGSPGGFQVNDIVNCYWNDQSNSFIPTSGAPMLRPANLDAALVSGGSAAAHLLTGSDRTGIGASITVYDQPTMITSGKQIPDDANLWVIWDRQAGKHVLGIPSECEEDQ